MSNCKLSKELPWNAIFSQKPFKHMINTVNALITGHRLFLFCPFIKKPVYLRYSVILVAEKLFDYDKCSLISAVNKDIFLSLSSYKYRYLIMPTI